MKFKNKKYIVLSLSVAALASCSAPKTASNKEINALPKAFAQDTVKKTQSYTPVTLNAYFNDAALQNLFTKAKAANPDLLITQQRITIANAFLTKAKLMNLPSLEIGATAQGNRYGKYTMDGVGNFDTNLSQNITEDQKVNRDFTPNYWIGAQTSWEIFAWGKLKNQKLAARKRFLATTKGIELVQNQLFTDIATLYYQLVALDKKLEIYENNSKIQQRAHEIINAQRIAGKANELAVQQFNAQNNNILAEVEKIKIEIVSTEKAILTLIGEYGGTVERGQNFDTNQFEILNQEIAVDEVIHNRPDVAENYNELEATKADVKAARSAFFPRLELSASLGYNAFSAHTLFKPASLATQVLGGLFVPVFNKGQIKYEFNVAKAQQEIAFLNYQKSVTTAYNELSQLLKHIEINHKILDLKQEEVQFLERAVEVSNDLYLTGYANYLEIINSQKNKLQAELDLLDAQHQNTKTSILLFKALGGKVN